MSLITDKVFVAALRSNDTLMGMLPAGNVYNPAIQLPDVDADNAPVPYIIVSLDGVQAADSTKDDEFDATEDRVQIGITVVGRTREELGTMAVAVRSTIREFFTEHEGDDSLPVYALIPTAMTFAAGGVVYDSLKPCFWQELTYNCDTNIDE